MSPVFDESHVFLGCVAATADQALALIADKAVELGVTQASGRDELLGALRQRESAGTTGMMGGFAIPHCTSGAVGDPVVLVLKFAEEVAWESMDGRGVRVAIALLMPGGRLATEHLRMGSSGSRALASHRVRTSRRRAADWGLPGSFFAGRGPDLRPCANRAASYWGFRNCREGTCT